MKIEAILTLLFQLIGGLGIFLLGMKNMSEGVQSLFGEGLRRMIGSVTNNRFLATGVGAGVTCLVQSSSVTTVLTVGLVSAGFMSLAQAMGVVMGANIGTTITGWILVLKIGKYGLPILGVGALFYLFSAKDRWRFAAMAGMGVGMVFFGLELMKDGFKPLRGSEEFVAWFHAFQADSYFGVLKCVLAGCILTFIVQSSSATLGITIALATTGVIEFRTAAALVLGENVGTTITAVLASLGATINAKRVAYFHCIFNILGVLWITSIFGLYIELIDNWIESSRGHAPLSMTLSGDGSPAAFESIVTEAIASVHTGFNVVNTLLFFPFVTLIARFLIRFVPDRPVKETARLSSLNIPMIESPSIAIDQSHKEVLRMGESCEKMFAWTREILAANGTPRDDLIKKVFHREEVLDRMQEEVTVFLTDLLSSTLSHSVAVRAREQIRISDEFESVSDYTLNILKAHLRMRKRGLTPSEEESRALLELHERVDAYREMVTTAFEHRNAAVLSKATTIGREITAAAKSLRNGHLKRMSSEPVEPRLSISYLDQINGYRKVKDHLLNIAEAVGEEI